MLKFSLCLMLAAQCVMIQAQVPESKKTQVDVQCNRDSNIKAVVHTGHNQPCPSLINRSKCKLKIEPVTEMGFSVPDFCVVTTVDDTQDCQPDGNLDKLEDENAEEVYPLQCTKPLKRFRRWLRRNAMSLTFTLFVTPCKMPLQYRHFCPRTGRLLFIIEIGCLDNYL